MRIIIDAITYFVGLNSLFLYLKYKIVKAINNEIIYHKWWYPNRKNIVINFALYGGFIINGRYNVVEKRYNINILKI